MNLTDDEKAFIKEIYQNLFDKLYKYANINLRNSSLADEAVQETFGIACQKVRELILSHNPYGWIMNTLKNVMRRIQREQAKVSSMTVELSYAAESVKDDDDRKITDIIYTDMLGQKDYELLRDVGIYSHSIAEIAMDLNISLEACYKRIQRVKQKARNIIKNEK